MNRGAGKRCLIPLLLAAATLAAWWPILRNDFVGLDDEVTVYGNPNLLHLTLESYCSFWTTPQAGLYAPLTYSLFAAITLVARKKALSGAGEIPFHAWPFHAASLLLHVLTVLVVYALLRRLIRRRWPAAAGARLLFSLHPLQVETVAWITEINGLLCGFLSLSAVLVYLKSITGRLTNWTLLESAMSAGVAPFAATDPVKRARSTPRSGRESGEKVEARLGSNVGRALPAIEILGGQCPPYMEQSTDVVGSASRTVPSGVAATVRSADPTSTSGDGIIAPTARQRKSGYALATELFILAMLAKPLGVIVPLLAAVVFWMARRRYARTAAPAATMRVPWGLAFWLVLAAPMALVARQAQPVPRWWVDVPLWHRPLVAADALAFYVYKLVWPITLLPDYDRSPNQILGNGWTYWAWIVPGVLAIIVAQLAWRRKSDGIVAGAIWFVAALLPVLGLTTFAFQRMSTVADRYLYLPMFGVSLAAAALLEWIASTNPTGPSRAQMFTRKCACVVTLAVLTALGIRTSLQIRYWHDAQAFDEHSRQEIGRKPGMPPG